MSESPEAQPGGSSPDGMETGTDAPVSTTASSLFDLRSVIALLFGVYGIVLLIMGLVSGNDPANLAKTGGLEPQPGDRHRDAGHRGAVRGLDAGPATEAADARRVRGDEGRGTGRTLSTAPRPTTRAAPRFRGAARVVAAPGTRSAAVGRVG